MPINNTIRLSAVICSAAISLVGTLPAATAQQAMQFDRQDLKTASGAARLLSEIEITARDLCLQENHYGTMRARTVAICLHDTVERTVEELDAPCLTDVYRTPLAQRADLLCTGTPQSDVR
jgi:UrcA family protein